MTKIERLQAAESLLESAKCIVEDLEQDNDTARAHAEIALCRAHKVVEYIKAE